MLFNSISFLIFFPVVTILYFLSPQRYRWAVLLTASTIFYMAFLPVYILILFALILVDYFAALWIERTPDKKKRHALVLSITATCLVLFIFKYFNFFAENLNFFANFLSIPVSVGFIKIALPLGLSFHTFQSLSYVVEVYMGRQKAEHNFGIYALYVMFYPQLVAGPIERPQHLLPQLRKHYEFEYSRVVSGLSRMLWGMFKKVVIADRLGLFVSQVFHSPNHFYGVTLSIAAVYFAIQLYCDFSGYVDIALGASKVMGIELTENFNRPYLATSVSDFWRRWHISLSSWLRDYVFMPTAARIRYLGLRAIIIATLITFAIAGIWHGASWNFVIFGVLQGIAISVETLTQNVRLKLVRVTGNLFYDLAGRLYTFGFWCFSLIFFRAESFRDAIFIISHLLTGWGSYFSKLIHYAGSAGSGVLAPFLMTQPHQEFIILVIVLVIMIYFDLYNDKSDLGVLNKIPRLLRWSVYYLLIFGIIFFGVFNRTPFIYFKF